MKKGTRADRRLKQEQRRGIVTMGRVGEGKSYLVDLLGRKVTFDAYGRISGKGIDKVRAEMRDREDMPKIPDPFSQLRELFGFLVTVSMDTKQPTTSTSHRINPPGTVDLIQREDGIYE